MTLHLLELAEEGAGKRDTLNPEETVRKHQWMLRDSIVNSTNGKNMLRILCLLEPLCLSKVSLSSIRAAFDCTYPDFDYLLLDMNAAGCCRMDSAPMLQYFCANGVVEQVGCTVFDASAEQYYRLTMVGYDFIRTRANFLFPGFSARGPAGDFMEKIEANILSHLDFFGNKNNGFTLNQLIAGLSRLITPIEFNETVVSMNLNRLWLRGNVDCNYSVTRGEIWRFLVYDNFKDGSRIVTDTHLPVPSPSVKPAPKKDKKKKEKKVKEEDSKSDTAKLEARISIEIGRRFMDATRGCSAAERARFRLNAKDILYLVKLHGPHDLRLFLGYPIIYNLMDKMAKLQWFRILPLGETNSKTPYWSITEKGVDFMNMLEDAGAMHDALAKSSLISASDIEVEEEGCSKPMRIPQTSANSKWGPPLPKPARRYPQKKLLYLLVDLEQQNRDSRELHISRFPGKVYGYCKNDVKATQKFRNMKVRRVGEPYSHTYAMQLKVWRLLEKHKYQPLQIGILSRNSHLQDSSEHASLCTGLVCPIVHSPEKLNSVFYHDYKAAETLEPMDDVD